MAEATGAALDAAGQFMSWLMNRGTTADTQQALLSALGQAQGAIQTAADRGMSYQQPYLQNAGQDYSQLRGLVNSGYFQQPLKKSFTSQQAPTPSFGFNPAAGVANFGAFQPGAPGTFTPPSLPAVPNFGQSYQPPAQVQQPQNQQPPPQVTSREEIQKIVQELMKNVPPVDPWNPTPNNQPYQPPGVNTTVGAPPAAPQLGVRLNPLTDWRTRVGSGSTVPTFGRGTR